MSDPKVGHCLPLYLKNRLLLSALEDEDALPADSEEDRNLLAQFRERASEQAATLLEELHLALFDGNSSPIPYRHDRQTQRRTVRQYWYVEGRLFRKHEKLARAFWNLYIGALRDKGPAVTLVLGPNADGGPAAFDELAGEIAPVLGLDSANARNCFSHKSWYEAGVIAAYAPLSVGASFTQLQKGIRDRAGQFFEKFRKQFEAALD